MADPKKPKQLTEASPLDEFTKTGNIYVDPSYTTEEATPAVSPITGEALTFGENTLSNFTVNNNNSPAVNPEDGHAIFVSNVKRSTNRGNGNDIFFNFNRSKMVGDIYITNTTGGDFSATPRVADTYVADSDGALNVYIENSTFGGNLMGFGSQTNTSQTFTGNYEFTFKNSQAQWFCITYGTGYGMGEGGAGNIRFGTLYGNLDLLVDGSTVTNNGVILAGGIHPNDGSEKAYLRAYIKDSLFQGEFGVVKTGTDGTMFKSEVDVDFTIEGSTFANVFLMFPNVATNTQTANGQITTTGDVNFKATNTRFAGLNMGAGLGDTGWNRTGWIKGNINFNISDSTNSSRTFVHKGFVGDAENQQTVTGTLTNSVFGDFTGYDTRENNHIYADTTIKMVGSTIGNFTLYNTINSGGTVTATANRVHGAQTLELAGVRAGNVAGNGPGAEQSDATFDLVIHASETQTQVGDVTQWDTITIEAGANVRANSLTLADGTLTIAIGSTVSAGSISGFGDVLYVTGELTEPDTVLVSDLTSELAEDMIISVEGVEYTQGIFPGFWEVLGGNLILHNASSTVFLVNSAYTDGETTGLGPKGYSSVAAAQANVDPDKVASTTIMAYAMDEDVPMGPFDADVVTKSFNTSFVGEESTPISLDGQNIVIGDTAADVESANFTATYTNNINKVAFGNVTGTAKVAIDHALIGEDDAPGIGTIDLTGAAVGDAQVSVSDSLIGSVKLADQEGFVGNVTIKNSEIGSVIVAESGATNDLTTGNEIKTVYAEGNGAAVKLGTSHVGTYVAGLSSAAAARETLAYSDSVSADTLIIGDATVDNSEDEPVITGIANTIGKIDATVTGGAADKLVVGADGNKITDGVDLTLAGGKFSEIEFNGIDDGELNVTFDGGTVSAVNGTFYGIVYGSSITGPLNGGSLGNALKVEGNAKVASISGFKSLEVTGGTLNVAGGDLKSDVQDDNTLAIDGNILNRRGINAGSISAKNLDNYGLIGVLRDNADRAGIDLSGSLVNDGYIKTSAMTVSGSFQNTGKITSVGDITVNGSFQNDGEIFFRSAFGTDGVFYQEGGLALNNVDLVNNGFISAATLTGVKNLTTSKLYVTGGASVTGNITIEAGAEVAFTNKANNEVENGLTLGGSITMYDTSALIVSGDLSTTGSKTITINVGDLIGSSEIIRAEGGVKAWTIKLAGAEADLYGYTQTDTSVVIFSLDKVYVNSSFSEDKDIVFNGDKLVYGLNAFATVEDAIKGAKAGTKIVIAGDKTGMDVTATAFDVELFDAVVGAVAAKGLYVDTDSTAASIASATVTINAAATLSVTETISDSASIVIDASEGSGSRLILDVDPTLVTIDPAKVSILAPAGKTTYSSMILAGEGEGAPAHAGDLYLISSDNAFWSPLLYKTEEEATKPDFVDGDTFDAATGDALFNGVNTFATREEAIAKAKEVNGTFVTVNGLEFNAVGEEGVVSALEVDFHKVDGPNRAIVGVHDDGNTRYEGTEDVTTMIIGSTNRGNIYGLTRWYTMTGDYTFIAENDVQTESALYITGNNHSNVMNGNVTAEISGSTFLDTYIGYGNYGTDETNPIDIDITITDSRLQAFYGIHTQRDNADPNNRQDINANINIKIYDSVIGGTFTVLNTNNDHWNGEGATLLQTYFSAGSINVEIGGTRMTDNIRVGAALEGGGKALQAFNVPNTLHIVATDNSTVTTASYLCEWDTIIVDATAQLQLNTLQYSTIAIDANSVLDYGGTLTQVMINMSGYKSGTHMVVQASGQIYTDSALSNITVIGDNDLTGQCQLAYGFSGDQLKTIAVFDKADDMYINTGYTDAVNGTIVNGQELLLNYNAHTSIDAGLFYANDWGGTIVVTGGTYEDQDFNGNNVSIENSKFAAITMGSRKESTLKVAASATFDSADGSGKSAMNVVGNATLGDVSDFVSVSVAKGASVKFGEVAGSNIEAFANNVITADSLDFSNKTISIDVTNYLGKAHAVIATENGITGSVDNVQLVGEDADKYGVVLTDKDLVVTTTIQSDTYLNATYNDQTTGTILADGTYLEYGFNAFNTAADAVANLGSSKNTVTVTGSTIADNITLNGANFVMLEGAIEGYIFGTSDDDFSGMNISINSGSVGGIALTAGDGAYSVSKAALTFGDGVTVDGVVAGAGDTTLSLAGNSTVGGIEDLKQITLSTSSLLTAGYIDLNGGTIYVTGGAVQSDEGNLRKIISTDAGIKGASYACDAGLTIYASGKDVYLMDLTRIYFDPTFTENITGTTMSNGDVLQWGSNAFSDLTDAMNHVVTGGTLYVNNYSGNVVNSATNKVISLNIAGGTIGTFRPIGDGQNNSKINYPVTIDIDGTRITGGIDYILGRSNSYDNVGNSLVYYQPVTVNLSNGRNDDNLRFVGQWDTINSGFTLNLTNWDIRGDFKPIFGDARAAENGNYHSFIDVTFDTVTLGNAGAKWITLANVTDWGTLDYINLTIKNSTLMTGTGGNNARIGIFDEGNDGRHNVNIPITVTVEDSHINAMLTASNIGGNRTTTYQGTSTLNVLGTESYIKWANWFQAVNMSVDTVLTGGTITFRPGTYQISEDESVDTTGIINVDATGYTGGSKILISLETGFQNVEPGSESFLLNLTQDSDAYQLVASTKGLILWDNVVTNLFYNPGYVDNNAVIGQTGPNGEVLVKTVYNDDDEVVVKGNAYGEEAEYDELLGFEAAKSALTAGNTLYITGGTFGNAEELSPIYGTIADEDATPFVNLGITGGRFSSIVVAEDGKTVTGDANVTLLGGNYGFSYTYEEEREVEKTDPETGETYWDTETVTLTGYTGGDLVGSADSVGGISTLTVSANVNVHGSVSEFDKMVVTSNATIAGDISVTALEIDCNATLTAEGALDLGTIHLASAGYTGPSKVVLKAAGLSEIEGLADIITVDGEDQFFYDGKDSLWLVSDDPGNVYVCTSFNESINGTGYNNDLLYYGINAFSSMEEALVHATSDYSMYVLDGVYDGVYDLSTKGQLNVQIDGGTIGGFVVGDGGDSDHRSTIRITATTAGVKIGSLTGVEGSTVGYRVVANQNATIATIDGIQYLRVTPANNVTVTDSITYRENGGELVIDLNGYTSSGAVLAPVNGIDNFIQLVDGQTYSTTTVGSQNNGGYVLYYDETAKSVKAIPTGNVIILDRQANSTDYNGKTIEFNGQTTTLVYDYNVSTWNFGGLSQNIPLDGALYVKEGYWFSNFFTQPIRNIFLSGSTIEWMVAGPNESENPADRTGDYTFIAEDSRIQGWAYFAGRGTADHHLGVIIGNYNEDTEEWEDGVYNITFKNSTLATGTENVSVLRYANVKGGTANVTMDNFTIEGDFQLFTYMYNYDGESLKEVNLVIKDSQSPAAKWMGIWDPVENNHTTVTMTITDSNFVGDDHTLGLFGTHTGADWDGEAHVYISGLTMGGRLSGARGTNAGDNAANILGSRTLHVIGTNNTVRTTREFTTIEIEEGAVLKGDTVLIPGSTAEGAGFILRGEAGYAGEVKEFVVMGTTISGVDQNAAQFLDAYDQEIEGFKAVVGNTNVFIYKPNYDVYYSSDYSENTTGTAITEADGTKNFLVYGDNAVNAMRFAYASVDARLEEGVEAVIQVMNGSGTLYTFGYKTVVNGGQFTNITGGTNYRTTTTQVDSGEVDPETGEPIMVDVTEVTPAEDVESVDITIKATASVNNVTVANEYSQVTGNSLITVADGVAFNGTLNGAAEFVGGASGIIFEGDSSAKALTGFDSVMLTADGLVNLSGTFEASSITIDATKFSDFTKKVLYAEGGFGELLPAVTVLGDGFGYEFLDDGKTLLVTSDLVGNVFANADWTEADVQDKFVGDMALVWDKNAFASYAKAAEAVTGTNTLNLEGGTSSENIVLGGKNDVVVSANTVGTAVGAISSAGGVLTVNADFTAESVSGFSGIVAKADAMSVTGGITLAEGATITIDMTGHVQEDSDAAILVTGEGITGITDDDIVLTGEGAGVYHAYYNHVDNSIHAMRIDNFYVDVAYGTAGELIPEGAVNPITGETLLFGVNAFYYLNDALGKMAPGQNLYINGRIGNNVNTRDQMANIYLTGSTVPVVINGYTTGDQTYVGDVWMTIVDSTFATAAGSFLFGDVTVDTPYQHNQHIFGDVTLNVIGSTVGGDTAAILLTGFSFVNVYGTEEDPALIQFNFTDSIIRDDILFIGDSPIGKTEEIGGQTYVGADVEINLTNVLVPQDKWWRIQGGDQNSEGTVTINITDSVIGGGDGSMRFSLDDNWGQGWGSTPHSASDFIFNLENSSVVGYLMAGRLDYGADDAELTTYTGAKTLNLTGANDIRYTFWFREVNLAVGASLTGRELRMGTGEGENASKINVDLTGYTGSGSVLVKMDTTLVTDAETGEVTAINGGITNITIDNINIIGQPEEGSPYTLLYGYDTRGVDYGIDPVLNAIVLKGPVKDIYLNNEYSLETLPLGSVYNGEPLFYGENAFDKADDAVAALTDDAVLFVTGGKVNATALASNSITIDAEAQLTYKGSDVITIDGTLTNDGTLLISAAGFVDGVKTDILVLTATEIAVTGGTFRTDDGAYSLSIVNDNELHLIMKKLDVFVNTEWEGLEKDTIVTIEGGTAKIGEDAFATADAAAAKVSANGSITILASDVSFSSPIVRTVTATAGSVVRNTAVGTSLNAGSLTLQSGAVAIAADVRGKGTLTVESGATVTGGLGMLSGAAVTFAEGSTLDFDISSQNAGAGASVTNYSILQGAPSITITIAADQADGTYALATDAASFNSGAVLQTTAGKIVDLVFGETVQKDGIDYTLAVDEATGVLSLTKQVYVAPITVTYVNSEWANLEDGTVVSGATIGYDGFATGDAAMAAVVAYGEVKVLGGEVSFTDPIAKTLTVNAGATLVGKASFETAATINGTVAFDTAFTADGAQIGDISYVSGDTTYTLAVSGGVGTYTLATGAAAFNSEVTFGSYTLHVSETVIVDNAFSYTIAVNADGTLDLTIAEYTPPTPETPTLAYVNSEWTGKDAGALVPVGEETATIGYNAFADLGSAIAGVTDNGAVEVVGGTVSFANGYSKTITVDGGATVVGNATFDAPITVNGTVAFDIANAAEGAQFFGLSYITGDTTYTLNVANPTNGTWTLATDAMAFDADVQFGDVTLKVGDAPVTVGSYSYELKLMEGVDLVLSIAEVIPPTPTTPTLAYVNSEWASLPAETIVTIEGGTAKIGYDAFAALAPAIAGVTDDGAVQVVGGTVSFADGYSKTITVNAGATVVGTATFDKDITINGTIAFDTVSGLADAQFEGFSFVKGNATYTLTDTVQVAGSYRLATDAASFNSDVAFGNVTLKVGEEAVLVGTLTYALGITNSNELVLTVEDYVPPTPTYDLVYVNNAWTGLPAETVVEVAGGTAVIGANAFASGDLGIMNVTDDGTVEVVAGEVSFTNAITKAVTIDAGATLVGNATFGTAITVNGTVAFDIAYAADGAQFFGINYVTGDTTYTLNVANPTNGTWTLATDAMTFDADVQFGDVTLKVGDAPVTVGSYSYELKLMEGVDLVLSIAEVIPPTPELDKAYVNSEWAGLPADTIVAIEGGTAKIGYDAFAALSSAEAAVIEDGAVQVVGGEISFADGYSKTITVDAGATVIGKATFDKAITINGTIAFNTADASSTAAQFNGFSFVKGNATYTLTAAAVAGTYLLASDAATFNSNVAFDDYTLAVGAEAVTIGDFSYALGITENNELALLIESVGPTPPPVEGTFYVNSAWADLPAGASVTVGEKTATIGVDAFATGDAAAAKATEGIKIEVIAGPVSFTEPITEDVTIEADAALTGKVEAGATITVNGTLVFDTAFATEENAQITGFDNIEFGDNAAVTLTVSGPVAADDKYILATGVTELPAGFTVTLEGHEGLTLSVNDEHPEGVVIDGLAYGLELDGDALVLSVVHFDNGTDKKDDKAALFNGKNFNKKAFDALDAVILTKDTTNIPLDKKFSVNEDGKYNFVGKEPATAASDADISDVRRVTLESGAKLTLNLDAIGSASGKFVVYQINEKNGKYTLKAVSTISFKNDFNQNTKKAFYLEAGDYLFAMEGKIKKDVASYYNVSLVGAGVTPAASSFFYEDDDDGKNNYLFDKKGKDNVNGWNPYVTTAEAIVLDPEAEKEAIQLDDEPVVVEGRDDLTNFVGFGDVMDVRKIELTSAANINFDVTLAGGAGKFFLYTIDAKGKLKTVANVALKASGSLKKPVLVEKGEYYVALQSTNAKKGEAVYYGVNVSANTTFYVDGDSLVNNYDSKAKAVNALVNANPVDLTKGELVIDGLLEGDADISKTVGGVEYHNFVGFGDASDIVKINAAVGDTLSLKVTSTDAVSLTLYGLKNGKVTSIKSVKSKNNVAAIDNFTFQAKNGSEFYVGVEATNAKKGEEAYYNLDVVSFSGDNGVSLDLAAADTFGAKDELSSGIIDSLAISDVSGIADAWDLDDKSSWQSLANLA